MLSSLARKILWFCKDYKLGVGHHFPDKPFRFVLLQQLDPKEQQDLQAAFDELVETELFEEVPSARAGSIPLALTRAGFDLIYGPDFQQSTSSLSKERVMTVQNFHFNAPANVQVGNHNTMQVIAVLDSLTKAIHASDASPAEKAEAKSSILQLVNNPVIAGILSSGAVEAVKALVGM